MVFFKQFCLEEMINIVAFWTLDRLELSRVSHIFLSITTTFIFLSRISSYLAPAELASTSIPFRFKAGGGDTMVTPSEQHHHRSTTKVSHKAYKTRFTSKNALKEQAKGRTN